MILGVMAISTMGASNPPTPGPNNGQITVANSSTVVTPTVFPGRFQITFLNPSTTITIYICQATQVSGGFISPTLKTCSSSVADISLIPGVSPSWSSQANGYTGQYTAITSSSTATLVINEN